MIFRNSFPTLIFFLYLIFISYFDLIKNISIISRSSIEKCINSDPKKDISCKSKMILSLTIQNGELQDSDNIETILDQVTDKDGNIQKFETPIKITFSKTPVEVLYPLTYFKDFNWQPNETIVKSISTSCRDSSSDEHPVCGWAKFASGRRVPDSQGFCCSCNFFSFKKADKRGTNCDGLFDISATGHCFRYSDIWYSAYTVEQYKINYLIKINVTNTLDNSTISYLELSPKNTFSMNEDKNILVKIIGDFLPADIFPRDYSNKFLLIPSKPENHFFVKEGYFRWMLVDKDKFTIDGSQCDKIGVSFTAFQNQKEKCNVPVQSCLKNQIIDLYREDAERYMKGLNTEYLIVYNKYIHFFFQDEDVNSRSFSYYLEGNINTLITLEMDTSIVKFITNVSSGKILKVYINNGFIAMSDDGLMEISVTNTGIFTAQFLLSYDCNDNIVPLSSNEISIAPEEIKNLNKSLYTRSNLGKINQCYIILKNSIGEKVDMKLIYFNTSTEISSNSQDYQNDNGSDINYEKKKQYLSCEELCVDSAPFFEFFCYINNSCWMYGLKKYYKKILYIVAIIIVFFIFVKCFKKIYCCCKCIKTLFCCCCLSKSKKKKSKKIESSNGDYEMENK